MCMLALTGNGGRAMAESRKCSKCEFYSYQLGRCIRGKINPKTIKGGVSAAEVMGFTYICAYCQLYDKIWEQLKKKHGL